MGAGPDEPTRLPIGAVCLVGVGVIMNTPRR